MIDLVLLAATIAGIVGVVVLRAMLALPFARMRHRFVEAKAPAGLAPLFDEAFVTLRSLGFGEPRWVLATRADGEPNVLPLRALAWHSDGTRVWLGSRWISGRRIVCTR